MSERVHEQQLVKRILAGDEAAFRAFFNEYVNRVYRFALTRLNQDSDAAKEVAQASLSKALLKLSHYRGEAQLFSWICSICRNESIDWLRRNNRYQENIVLIEDHPDVRAAVESLHIPEMDTPYEQAKRSEVAHLIQIALDGLPSKYGNALEWMYIEGCSVREIAERLGVGTEAAQSLLARAKRAFADVYTTLNQTAASNKATD